ncbi:ABC transporter permease [Actinomadura sp. NPDC047616]|uniref:ABC transporter permease n=1 Tax=Actinomadura sp. NPDC047616 TaxID=3155914 RepID=UPI0033C38531
MCATRVHPGTGPKARYPSVTFRNALWSEWTKIRTLRSARDAMIAAAVLMILCAVFGLLAGRSPCRGSMAAECAAFEAVRPSLQGYHLAQVAFGLLGVLAVTSEYATGMIGTSLAAAPRRGRLLAAKAAVCSLVALLVGGGASAVALFLGRRVDAGDGALSGVGMLQTVTGAGLFLALMGLAGVAVGVLVRTTAAALVVLVVATLVVPALCPLFPGPLEQFTRTYWPVSAGAQIMAVRPALPPWTGLGLLAAAVAVTLAAAAVVFHRREY